MMIMLVWPIAVFSRGLVHVAWWFWGLNSCDVSRNGPSAWPELFFGPPLRLCARVQGVSYQQLSSIPQVLRYDQTNLYYTVAIRVQYTFYNTQRHENEGEPTKFCSFLRQYSSNTTLRKQHSLPANSSTVPYGSAKQSNRSIHLVQRIKTMNPLPLLFTQKLTGRNPRTLMARSRSIEPLHRSIEASSPSAPRPTCSPSCSRGSWRKPASS